ncbi:MAG: hypothetical protein MRY83_04595 [Flavobacteriales bacterium]|nr:hypothetical protein [Flavobacteriales bacterium]
MFNFQRSSSLPLHIKSQVFELWNEEFPSVIGLDELQDFDNYLELLQEKEHIYLLNNSKILDAWSV